jgi:hypothetical protein
MNEMKTVKVCLTLLNLKSGKTKKYKTKIISDEHLPNCTTEFSERSTLFLLCNTKISDNNAESGKVPRMLAVLI